MKCLLSLNTLLLICVFSNAVPYNSFCQEKKLPVGGNVDVDAAADVRLSHGHVPQTRLHMRDLGIAPYDVIPSGQTAITSMVVGRDGNIYGGTTGEVANLLVFSHEHNIVFPLGTIPGEESVYHSLVAGDDGSIYAGTIRNVDRIYHPDEKFATGRDWWYKSVSEQIKQDYEKYDGGHIYRYHPSSTRIGFKQETFRINKPCPLEDLGISVPHEGIYTLTNGENSNTLYGITYPSSKFFKFDLTTDETTVISTLNTIIPTGDYEPPISKALVKDNYGNIYANIDSGYLIRYTPETGVIDTLNIKLPGLNGRELYNYMNSAVLHPGGRIYGGTKDGYVFCCDPETAQIHNLGKPLIETQIRAMTVGHDGNIYGVGGRIGGVCRLFTYIVSTHEFVDIGIMDVSIVPYYEWKAFEFDSMVTGPGGSIYLGNSEYRSRLFIYNP